MASSVEPIPNAATTSAEARAAAGAKLAAATPALRYLVELVPDWTGGTGGGLVLLGDDDATTAALTTADGGDAVELRQLLGAIADGRAELVVARAADVVAAAAVRLHGQSVGALYATGCHDGDRADAALERLGRLATLVEAHLAVARDGEARSELPVLGTTLVDGDLRVVDCADPHGPEIGPRLVGQAVADVVSPQLWPRVRHHFLDALAGKPSEFDMRWPGEVDYWSIALSPVADDRGRPVALLSTHRAIADGGGHPPPTAAPDDVPFVGGAAAGRAVFDGAREAMIVFDPEGVPVAVNRAARHLYRLAGANADSLRRWRHTTTVADADGRPLLAEELPVARVLATGRPVEDEVLRLDLGSRRLVLRMSVVPIERAGTLEGAIAFATDITDVHRASEDAQQLAVTDPVTALPNRLSLLSRLDDALERPDRTVTVLAVDVDGFKLVNDAFGGVHGDAYLRAVGSRVAAAAPDGAVVARMGGDEFVVLLEAEAAADRRDALAVASRVVRGVAGPMTVAGVEHAPTCSVGVTVARPPDVTPAETLGEAGLALRAAKGDGGNTCRGFVPAMRVAALERETLVRELRRAIGNGELRLHYQPIVDADDRLVALEALIRWQHPDRGLLAPGEFIPTAEQSALIVDVGTWLLGEACRQLGVWRERWGLGALPVVHVNVAAAQLKDAALPQRVDMLLRAHDLPATTLTLEVTETMVMAGDGTVRRTLDALHERGLKVGLDDFGTGFSSLAHLLDLPISALKVDRSFVSGPDVDARRVALVAAMCEMARRLGLELVAEGVETEAQRRLLLDLGCQRFQGFLIGRPAPAEHVEGAFGTEPRLPRRGVARQSHDG